MDGAGYDLVACLEAIDPAACSYEEWVEVGMALHAEGYPEQAWDEWSRRDAARYHPGECSRKWRGFDRSRSDGVSGGTIVKMARDAGWEPSADIGTAMSWDDTELWDGPAASRRPGRVLDPSWVESSDVEEPGDEWEGWRDLSRYLDAVFEPGELVSYVVESRYDEDDGRWKPMGKGITEPVEDVIQRVRKHKSELDASVGWNNAQAGAWVRFNPMDGKGVRNDNVAEYRYALVESDSVDVGRQMAIVKELNLPVAAMVHSGNKSMHAIVRVDAGDYAEYRRRVDYLYAVCKKNGLPVDTQNKNPSRLSRMPGVTRAGRKQWLVATDVGAASWAEWREWLAEQEDDLPEPESLADVWDDMPELAPPLIDGVLRQGHKMLLAGPSKAGKSFALIELCVAVAEGERWLGFQCEQGRVLYVNLELDRASCMHRFRDVVEAMGADPACAERIDVWNLRGKSKPMDQLAPSLIRRALKSRPIMVVIDPIYKIITGDENSADQMARFCNQFDKVATEIGCAVVYCHHHSKGAQGQKASMDRASGSGVFARDPDALVDMTELHRDEAVKAKVESEKVASAVSAWAAASGVPGFPQGWADGLSADAAVEKARGAARDAGDEPGMLEAVLAARKAASARTAWRLDATLREFPAFDAVDLWFDYPLHHVDSSGELKGAKYEGDFLALENGRKAGRAKAHDRRKRDQSEKNRLLHEAMEACAADGALPTRANVSDRIGELNGKPVSADMVRRWTNASASPWSEVVIDPEHEREGLLKDTVQEDLMAEW